MEYEDTYDFCKPYLTNEEYILWRGKPGKGNILQKSDIFMIPFSLFWCSFAVVWELGTLHSGAGMFSLFGLPFILVGLYLVFGRFIHAAWNRRHTRYVITNLKVIRLRNRRVDVLMGKGMPPMSVTLHKNGNGTINIGQYTYYNTGTRGRHTSGWVFTLENIPDVARVQQILTQISSQ